MLQPPLFREDLDVRTILILINPPEAISNYASSLKKEITKNHGAFDSSYSTPHITICNFPIMEYRIEKILPQISAHISMLMSFKLAVSGFSFFVNKNKRTFYMRVVENDSYEKLKSLFKSANKEIIRTKKFKLINKPHITIAKSLDKKLFKEINNQYGRQVYEMEFEVNSLTVLKYVWQDKKYQKIGDINLMK